jgi:hypothetical protein
MLHRVAQMEALMGWQRLVFLGLMALPMLYVAAVHRIRAMKRSELGMALIMIFGCNGP